MEEQAKPSQKPAAKAAVPAAFTVKPSGKWIPKEPIFYAPKGSTVGVRAEPTIMVGEVEMPNALSDIPEDVAAQLYANGVLEPELLK